MMADSRVEKAARNNAHWCETVCRAHSVPGEFHDTFWLNRHPVPRFYPNVITLSADQADTQLANIKALISDGLTGNWGVKDSFCSLNLKPIGFQMVVEATWLWRDPAQPLPPQSSSTFRWKVLQTDPELSQWEKAWSDDSSQPRVFLPPLLADPNILFIAGYQNEALVAGAIANHTNDVVGLSNVFTPPDNRQAFWAGCVARIQELFPTLSIVGYERGLELTIAQEIGFEAIQPLKIWIRQA